jgi:beta-glucanase (GH16 family)
VQWDASRTPMLDIVKRSGHPDLGAWSRDFHEWQFDWTPDRMEFRLDGQVLNTVELSKTIHGTPDHANPFHEPQAFILNLAIGGTSGGDPSATEFPARFEVDWISVWQSPASTP